MRLKIRIKDNRDHLFTFKEAFGHKYRYNSELNTYKFHSNEDTKIVYEDDADFFMWIENRWILFDHTISLQNKYNKMLIDSQLKGFNNVAEHLCSK